MLKIDNVIFKLQYLCKARRGILGSSKPPDQKHPIRMIQSWKLILNWFYKPDSSFCSISKPILGWWPDTLGVGGIVYIWISTHGLGCVTTVVQIYFAFISTPPCPRSPTPSGEDRKCLHCSHVQWLYIYFFVSLYNHVSLSLIVDQ